MKKIINIYGGGIRVAATAARALSSPSRIFARRDKDFSERLAAVKMTPLVVVGGRPLEIPA